MMAQGTVKWFNPKKGYGFITPDEGDKDIFIHISAVEKAGMDTLHEGQRLSFEISISRGKEAASELEAL